MKIEIKMVLTLVSCAVVLFVIGSCREAFRYKIPPPGWTIVSDGQGHWGAKPPHEYSPVLSSTVFGSSLKSRQAAINRAWEDFNLDHELLNREAQKEPKPERDWK